MAIEGDSQWMKLFATEESIQIGQWVWWLITAGTSLVMSITAVYLIPMINRAAARIVNRVRGSRSVKNNEQENLVLSLANDRDRMIDAKFDYLAYSHRAILFTLFTVILLVVSDSPIHSIYHAIFKIVLLTLGLYTLLEALRYILKCQKLSRAMYEIEHRISTEESENAQDAS